MAKIIKTGTQEQALRTINSNLRILAGVNNLLSSKEEESYGINITAGKQRVFMLVEKSFGDKLLMDIRRKLVKETKSLTKKNAIVLDDNDLEALENRHPDKESSEVETKGPEMPDGSLEGKREIHDGGQ